MALITFSLFFPHVVHFGFFCGASGGRGGYFETFYGRKIKQSMLVCSYLFAWRIRDIYNGECFFIWNIGSGFLRSNNLGGYTILLITLFTSPEQFSCRNVCQLTHRALLESGPVFNMIQF